MRVFVTGATGFIGMAVVRELVGAGHRVLGLSRTEAKAADLARSGAEVRLGTIEDAELMAALAAEAEGVVHLAFNHEAFPDFATMCAQDRRAIEALGRGLAGSGRTLVMTSGTAMAMAVDGVPAREDGPLAPVEWNPRSLSETLALSLGETGVAGVVVRLPQVHDTRKQGLLTYAIAQAREKGVFAYVGDGHHRWPAAHVSDVARLYRLALEAGSGGARYHAVAEEGIAARDMAEAVGRRLGLPVASVAPEEAEAQLGWLAHFVGLDMPASSAWTRAALGWRPTGPGLLEDLAGLEVD